jgi:hypothetical protein
MKRLKTFESFIVENFADPYPEKTGGSGNTYYLYMFDSSTEGFSGEVRDGDGKCVFTITPKILEDGGMSTPDDVTGLRKYLIEKKKKLSETDVIEIAQSAPVQTTD